MGSEKVLENFAWGSCKVLEFLDVDFVDRICTDAAVYLLINQSC